jgi:hypothetical protein
VVVAARKCNYYQLVPFSDVARASNFNSSNLFAPTTNKQDVAFPGFRQHSRVSNISVTVLPFFEEVGFLKRD